MGGRQRQVMCTLALLTIIGLTIVAGRPAEDLQVLDSETSVIKDDPQQTSTVQKENSPSVDGASLLSVLPTSLTQTEGLAELKPEDVKESASSSDSGEVPVVIADLPLPEAMVIVPDESRERFLTRLARAHLPAEARDADESDGYNANMFTTYYDGDIKKGDSGYVVLEVKNVRPSPGTSKQSPVSPPARLEDPVIFLGSDEEDHLGKRMRKHRVLFRSDQPITSKIDARGSDESVEGRSDSRKIIPPGSPHNVQNSPPSHTYQVTEPGRETIVFMKPNPIQSDAPDKQPKLQLIRHIHHQQFAVPFFNPSQPYPSYPPQIESIGQKFGAPFANNRPSGISIPSPVQPVTTPNASPAVTTIGGNNQQSAGILPPVFGDPQAHSNQGSARPPGQITGYFPFDQNPSLYNAAFTQSITNIFEYGDVRSSCTHSEKQTRSIRRRRAINALPENPSPKDETTTEIPIETTVPPQARERGSLAGPVVQTISQDDIDDDEDKVQTTIVLHGGPNEPNFHNDDEDDVDDEDPPLSETALDDTEDEIEEESAPSINKGEFQKKLKDKLDKIEQKIRKRVKNSQQNLSGLRRQVNRHVTEVVMHSEGGLEEAGPFVSKLVVRKGGVAIAGPGGIATAGFGGTAIVGPGGTAYTSPDSLAVAGPGARVISVPSSKLQEMFDSFRKGSGRNIEAFKPSWLGTIPPDGKLVATGPVVFFNPPEQAIPGFTLA